MRNLALLLALVLILVLVCVTGASASPFVKFEVQIAETQVDWMRLIRVTDVARLNDCYIIVAYGQPVMSCVSQYASRDYKPHFIPIVGQGSE